jgi:hypothetical protein
MRERPRMEGSPMHRSKNPIHGASKEQNPFESFEEERERES